MADQNAARQDDHITCPMVGPGPTPHDPSGMGNAIGIQTSSDVKFDNKGAACIGSMSLCKCPPVNPVISGAMMVLINNKPPARQGELGAHPGSKVADGSSTVLIGGPSCSGNPVCGTEDCIKARAGRANGRSGQSYQNCSVESARIIAIRAKNNNQTEDEMLDRAMHHGWARR